MVKSGKERIQKYRERRAKEGDYNVNVYVSKETKEIIDALKIKHGGATAGWIDVAFMHFVADLPDREELEKLIKQKKRKRKRKTKTKDELRFIRVKKGKK